ncbi:MAG: hypothetical protein AMXMBFR53_10800 [Gemmatimonadota bacterium]
MTDARAFLATRTPAPPPALGRWLAGTDLDGASPGEGLAREALAALDRARSAPGRVRESAFHLLGADALLTYACEAALEGDHPDGDLAALMERAAEHR